MKQGSPGEGAKTFGLVGRLVAKRQGESLLRGVVTTYNIPTAGKSESWSVAYDDEPKPKKIGRSKLEEQLDLHMQTAASESSPV